MEQESSSRRGWSLLRIHPIGFIVGLGFGAVFSKIMLEGMMSVPFPVLVVSWILAPITALVAYLGSHFIPDVANDVRTGALHQQLQGYWNVVFVVGSVANGLALGWLTHVVLWSRRENRKPWPIP